MLAKIKKNIPSVGEDLEHSYPASGSVSGTTNFVNCRAVSIKIAATQILWLSGSSSSYVDMHMQARVFMAALSIIAQTGNYLNSHEQSNG